MRLLPRLAVVVLAAAWLCSAADDAAPKQEHPPAGEILSKAVAWATWHREQKFYKRWRFEHLNETDKLTDAEAVDSTETRTFEGYPLAGEQFYEMVRRDGKPLNAADLRKEAKRKREFIEEARKKSAGKGAGQSGEDEPEVEFNEELISRYRAEVAGVETIGGRAAYVVRFEPREGPLPVRRRTDHALNRSHGRLWIDAKDFVVLQVEFELLEPVRMWGGLLGSLSRLRGRLTMTELGGGAWHYETLDIHVKGRVLFNSFHQDQRMAWKNFEPIEVAARE